MPKVLIFGPQGSGKGTQAAFLAEALHIPALSLGELLRQEQRSASAMGRAIDEVMTYGGLVSDVLALEVLKKRLRSADARQGYVVDGYPRNRAQFQSYLTFDRPTHVLVLEISDDEAVERLSGRRSCRDCGAPYHVQYRPPKRPLQCDRCSGELVQRPDDLPQAIEKRLSIYHRETAPLLSDFENLGIPVYRVNARGSPEDVKKRIRSVMYGS
jgi:adenylate kinase